MAIDSPFKMTFGSLSVGGTSDIYQIHGPHIIEKSYEHVRFVFDVIVVGTSYATLKTYSANLEAAFSARDVSFTVDLDAIANAGTSVFTYTHGTTLLNPKSTISKTGNEESDRGYSRAYTCIVEGELPASDNSGLRDLEVNVQFEDGRRKIVTMSGTYTALSGATASAQYASDFPTEATTLLTAIDSGATFELVDENYTQDRNNHTCRFQQQWVELLANQSISALNDTQIRNHSIRFVDITQGPGDSREGIHRMRRTVADYDCAVDIDQTTNLQTVYASKILPHLRALFFSYFFPTTYAIENLNASFDETSKRISISCQFVYLHSGGNDIVEVTESVAWDESRTLDKTYVHDGGEYSCYVDQGWSQRMRIWDHTVLMLGSVGTRRRIGPRAIGGESRNPANVRWEDNVGESSGPEESREIQKEGWNLVRNTSRVSPLWFGDPTFGQIRMTRITESITEEYSEEPKGRRG